MGNKLAAVLRAHQRLAASLMRNQAQGPGDQYVEGQFFETH
jgi:hypothetical protein